MEMNRQELYIMFSTCGGGTVFLPTNRHDLEKYKHVVQTIDERKQTLRTYDVGTCSSFSDCSNVLCIVDRYDGEYVSRLKFQSIFNLIMSLKPKFEKIIMFLPKLHSHYIKNSKYTTALLNENIHILFI